MSNVYLENAGYTDCSIQSVMERYTMSNKKSEWILIKEAAEIMGIHIESVRRLCRKEAIKCRQLYVNAPWEVLRKDAESYEKNVGGRGNKTKL